MGGHEAGPGMRSSSPKRGTAPCRNTEKLQQRKRGPIPPELQKIKVEVQSTDSYVKLEPNALEATRFETSFFEGQAMLLVRTNPIEPHLECFFSGRKRLFEVQVQGRFKRKPCGEVYVGGEVDKKLEMGLITRSVSHAAIRLCSSMVDGLCTSFGDKQGTDNYQLPHLVAPLFATFDKIIKTPPGEKPPPLGVPFEEDLSYRKERLAYKSIREANVGTEETYSFSVNTSYVNLPNWTVVNIPMVRPMNLRTFLTDIPFQLVAYEISFEDVSRLPHNIHPHRLLNYVFNMRITHCPEGQEAVIMELPFGGSDDEVDDDSLAVSDDDTEGIVDSSGVAGIQEQHQSMNEMNAGIAEEATAIESETSSEEEDGEESCDDMYVDADEYSALIRGTPPRPMSVPITTANGIEDTHIKEAMHLQGLKKEEEEEGYSIVFDREALSKALEKYEDYYEKHSSLQHESVEGPYLVTHDQRTQELPPLPRRKVRSPLTRSSRNRRRERKQREKLLKSKDTASGDNENERLASNGVGGWIRRHISTARSTVTQSVAVPSNAAASLAASAAHGLITGVEVASSAAVEAVEIVETPDYCAPDVHFEAGGDVIYCPASLDLIDRRHDKAIRRTFYFLPLLSSREDTFIQDAATAMESINPRTPRLRSYSEIVKFLSIVPIPRLHKNRRLSRTEKRRRQIIASCMALMRNAHVSNSRHNSGEGITGSSFLSKMGSAERALNRYESSLLEATDMDRDFLLGNVAVSHRINTRTRSHIWEGNVALAVSSRHWIEYQMLLNRNDVRLFLTEDVHRVTQRIHRRAAVLIPLSSVLSVKQVFYEEIPIPGVSFLQIETFPRIYYLMARSDIQVHGWIEGFVHHLGSGILQSPFDRLWLGTSSFRPVATVSMGANDEAERQRKHKSMPLLSSSLSINHSSTGEGAAGGASRVYELEGDAYLAKSASWKLDKKRLFNYRRIIFGTKNLPDKFHAMRPNEFVESLLANIFYLSNADIKLERNAMRWITFLEDLSYLQVIDLSSITNEREKVALFLNLYHVMVLHGGLVVGYPPAWNYWNAFYNNICYIINYDIYSIADLEYNVLKAGMTRPSSVLSMIPIPNHQYPAVAVAQRDFRLNFCINNGSRSMPNLVPIYRPDSLDDQLDEMTEQYLKHFLEEPVDYQKRIIFLPKVPMQDFSINSSSSATATDCLRHLAHYFPRSEKPTLLRLLSENVPFTVRFKNQSLRCRQFYLYSEESEVLPTSPQSSAAATPRRQRGRYQSHDSDNGKND